MFRIILDVRSTMAQRQCVAKTQGAPPYPPLWLTDEKIGNLSQAGNKVKNYISPPRTECSMMLASTMGHNATAREHR